MVPDHEIEAYYYGGEELGLECIRLYFKSLQQSGILDLDIRDAVFLRFQLDGAISDYEKAVGR